ncbi:MAG: glycosyl transferase [Alphaproteobacteria bacterium]|nr:glycosyl transferase [Alphaproteobacteria bacterium]
MAGAGLFALATYAAITPVKTSLHSLRSDAQTLQVADRAGQPLTISYQNRWNVYDNLPLYQMPELLRQAFVVSEDKRFFEHAGVDWRARGSALIQNLKTGEVVRGASTITEQVVRMINPRPRTLWGKWVEGWESALLERNTAKADILEFYLNQVPYAANRRGVVQAARYYFDRDISTLTPRETLALAVLARAPSSYDLYKDSTKIDGAIGRLATALQERKLMSADDVAQLQSETFKLAKPADPVNASHFAQYVRNHVHSGGSAFHSTLDAQLQASVQKIVDDRVRTLERRNLKNAAVLVADHTTGEILAWVVSGANDPASPTRQIDAVTVPRQPGSAQKPLLYGLALDNGWNPATIIEDAPLAEAIGTGLHNFKNYSNTYYGRITLREALGNSLNIPALKTVNYVGKQKYLTTLHRLGFESLNRGVEIYDEGLALGNGEVTLLEMAQGFAALANRGMSRPLHFLSGDTGPLAQERIYSPEAASLIGDILSDPWARRLEFGNGSVLNFPMQTAAKTGTSTDYRDAWTLAYNHKYVVGMWMGNLDHTPTDGVTGATGPALAVRSIFSMLNLRAAPRKLWLSPKLVQKDVCIEDPRDASRCYNRSEYFMEGGMEDARLTQPPRFEIVKPTAGLRMALDPRIPRDRQKVPFTMRGLQSNQTVEWILNGQSIGTSGEKFMWPLSRGKFLLTARVMQDGKLVHATPEIDYTVR